MGAAPEVPPKYPEVPPKYSVFLVGKAPSPEEESPVLAAYHSDESMDEARAGLASAQGGEVAASDLLMIWYSEVDYRGASAEIRGSAGPCDRSGYRLDTSNATFGIWGKILSSARRGVGQCNTARFFNRMMTYSEMMSLPTNYVGDTLNDNVGRIDVYFSG